ncbi:tail protein X [Brucella anthropi]|uniref:Phage tail X family protein n=1 Tax=Brucella anthropi (strain ATCC 49188 / DSM 6882 / CCUG 24695 / JCM 21032 / LMG 3331 / NBRC 15819 / NCTC 12168 / Alc 37) TaxID=439375 RepID=A6WYZ9_BRUA4|nr:tail protein X [Brucella anthropi]ABS14203.1 phage tail X family protein [Brucella anthropi ATCC 49188]NKC48100.1 phage tail protein [Brucella anthropi ATCC 49188]QQC25725.1 tail protein X [Brucella anthropi]RRY08790.1 phage tail protein [Brucella anthropi]SUA65624.1 Phage Tail Protein X [Brucella anthropi]
MNILGFERVTVMSDLMTLDLIIWQRFQRPMIGLIEATYELPQNQDLAELGAFIPVGTVVTIPIPNERDAQNVEITSLWD